MSRAALFASVAVIGLASASAASAADLPARNYYKAAPIAAAPTWTGAYWGVNVGYGVTNSNTTNDFGAGFIVGSDRMAADGVIGGAQIGYNWQSSPTLLWGLEADFQGSGIRGSNSQQLFGGAAVTLESRLNWFGTVRGRLGWIMNPSTVAYVTGGLAYGETELNIANTFVPSSASATKTSVGYTVGGGVETKLWGNWSAKAEYLYLDLGNQSVVEPTAPQAGSVDFRSHIVRAGLNYRF